MKKIIFLVMGVLALLAIAGLIIFYLQLGRIIKAGIETVGPRLTKCPVSVADIDFKPLRGKLTIRQLVLGNPQGFKTDSAFSVKEIRVSMIPKSILSDEIRITEVHIDAPQVTYEIGLGKTNIGTIQKNVREFIDGIPGTGGETETAPKPKTSGKPGKKVVIDHVLVQGGQIRLSGTILQGNALPMPLPTVELRDIGKGDPVSVAQATAEILDEILGGVVGVVKQSGQLLKDAAKEISGTAKATGETLQKGAGGLIKGVKGIFGKGK